MRSADITSTSIKLNTPASEVLKQTKEAKLVYINDQSEGITRKRSGKGFIYFLKGARLYDEKHIIRIKNLAIPPAWIDVWICTKHTGHLQATGIDTMQRKQYRYHTLWNELRNNVKFDKLLEFGDCLPQLRLQLEKDIANKELTKNKVIALVICLMERTFIRIGNNSYEKLYGSYGLTTMKDQHVKFKNSNKELTFSFKGKKGVYHSISLKNKKLVQIVKQCRDIPGKELFQYYDENGLIQSIDSGDVNDYIHDITGKSFTAKDFRTWAGSLCAISEFKKQEVIDSVPKRKKYINEVLDVVSSKLGNTRTVCKKYYVHPGILKAFEENCLNEHRDCKTNCAI